MRHLPIALPLAALAAACLMTTPFASSQTPVPTVAPAVPTGAQAVQPASTPEALSAELVGRTFYLRGFYQDDKLEFATDGKPVGAPQRGSFALSAVEIDKVKFTKHSMEIEAHRVGLHFFGALPYEDDTKPFERIKVDPKKGMEIEVDRLVIEPEKKKKRRKTRRRTKRRTQRRLPRSRRRHRHLSPRKRMRLRCHPLPMRQRLLLPRRLPQRRQRLPPQMRRRQLLLLIMTRGSASFSYRRRST